MFQISLIQEHKKKLKKIDLITKIKINLWVQKEVEVERNLEEVQKEQDQEKKELAHQKLIMKKQLQQQIKSE